MCAVALSALERWAIGGGKGGGIRDVEGKGRKEWWFKGNLHSAQEIVANNVNPSNRQQ